MVPKANSVIEVTKPDRSVVISDGSILLESQATINGFIVSISLVVIPKSSSQMSRDKANACIREVETDRTASFVASDSGKTGLSMY